MHNSFSSKIIFQSDKWDTCLSDINSLPAFSAIDTGRSQSLANLINSSVESIYNAITGGWTMMLGYSSGKDSETLLHLFLIALIRAVRNGAVTSRHHFLLHTDTLIENPEVHYLAQKKLGELQAFIDKNNLPFSIVQGQPSLTSSWTGRVLTGRGLPTFTNSSARQCTQDLKINSARRAKADFIKGKKLERRVCLMLGSRDAESKIRASNIAKVGGNAHKVKKVRDGGELYAIKNWLASDVWEFLLSCGENASYPLPSYLESNNETAEVYRSATGECIWTTQDKKQSEACSARFGCWACQAVGLDKSMETLLNNEPERYGYMQYLNRIQRFLAKRRYAWEDRHPVGRTLYGNGFIKIQPDVYSPAFLERLLHVCCSVDFMEQQRADNHFEQLLAGAIDDTPYNRRMCEPQFRIVSEQALVHIDFLWAFHHFNAKPYRALEIFHKVWSYGELDLLDDEPGMAAIERTAIPEAIWVKAGKWGYGSCISGLADPSAEMSYFDGGGDPRAARVIKTPNGNKRVVAFEDDDELTVDHEAAEFIIWCEYPRLRRQVMDGFYTAGSAAQFYLRFGAVQIAAGKAALYDKMMERGQTLHRLKLTGFQTVDGIAARRDLRVLSNDKFRYVTSRTIEAKAIQLKFWCCMYLILSQYTDGQNRFRPVLVTEELMGKGKAA
ncbi:phosphoadenosine phosphosulfate reductase [Citrobacter sp. Cpo150]|uniref:phosphoadenosine phosphosulfate reductase n=1 Tax=Citrobacter sp. Cpo150 TaxID=2985154 RepID=UPI002577B869|nr:phosphoadenosine phosphosulfate reductase [Citrobacter sp. Cpo150]MDM2765676.1 phosphoadenosine phosphosulfate reductase [Citrobacter sp. Cpo150]